MIQPDHELSIKRQAELLNIARGSAYYVRRPVSDADAAMAFGFAGLRGGIATVRPDSGCGGAKPIKS